VAVGADTHFVYGFTHSPLRRKGTMTARQREHRRQLDRQFGRPDPKAVELGIVALLRLAAPTPQPLTVRSDEHPAYPRALRRLGAWTVRHECTPSVASRTPQNPLFPVNLLDLLLRHNGANHKRETIACLQQARSERGRARGGSCPVEELHQVALERHGGGTPAMRLGLIQQPLSWRAVLNHRLFPDEGTTARASVEDHPPPARADI
jgi:hypothetical protein